MKLSKSVYVTVLILFLSLSSYGQTSDFFTVKKSLAFNQSSKTEGINMKIGESIENLYFKIQCSVKIGNVTIQILDPNGKNKGEFTIEAIETGNSQSLFSEGVVGEISRSIKKPKAGNWSIQFLPSNSTGQLEIETVQETRDI